MTSVRSILRSALLDFKPSSQVADHIGPCSHVSGRSEHVAPKHPRPGVVQVFLTVAGRCSLELNSRW